MPPHVIPADLKTIKAYIKRAEELDLDRSTPTSRLVAYYCRQFAVERGLTANATSSESKSCLMQIMDELEKERELIGNGFSREEAYTICLDFAQNIFDKADQEDRNGKANQSTARTFYAAAIFYEILEQFDKYKEDESDNVTRRKYSKWKAAQILNAIKSGWFNKGSSAGNSGDRVNADNLDDAIELVRFGLVALQTKEIDLARKRLQEALSKLG
ncbi:hypothetical protein ScalyP_jg11087 [Parmales sp. scaly parma]|nr:hypothetical protein ScalyP_jg11087 [Parmales sp. scaly parma]